MDRKGLSSLQFHQNKTSGMVALNAVAFQDHWARSLAIGKTTGPRQVGLGPAARAKQKKDVRPVVDTGRSKSKSKVGKPVEKEYVLDEKPPPLTLAQKLGLVEAPMQHLSENEWGSVKAKSNARDDSKEPCVICKEDFGLQQQVLLSCSHVFHRACLQAFERYTGRKTCPMCRREQYQTRVIHEGAKLHRQKCATRIQAAWRGYVVRSWYKKLRQTVPPKDPKLRKKFYIEKLEAITDRMVRSCDFDVNSFLREIDHSLERSRDIFRHFDAVHRIITDEEWEAIQLKAVERSNQDCPICLTSLTQACPDSSSPDLSNQQAATSKPKAASKSESRSGPKTGPHKSDPRAMSQTSKTTISKKRPGLANPNPGAAKMDDAQKRGGGEGEELGGWEDDTTKAAGRVRRTVLLSCTHVFHETCLQTLEELAMGEVRNLCPICRAVYHKRSIPTL
ncbi:RING finger protein 32-like [Babylonia areolata]|uniref:RING finger protein 32-like n=1 Tax=Babylonia areolata TaxID=304850 RepID=UPI003FCF5BB4